MSVDSSTNPQIEPEESIDPDKTEQEKIDQVADSMASKAGRVEHQSETTDNVGGVRPTSGGIFTK